MDRITRAGGLALLWKSSVSVKVVDSSLNFIDAIVNDGQEDSWRFTGIYGFSETRRKVETWQLLRELNNKYNIPWVCAGTLMRSLEAMRNWVDLQEGKLRWKRSELLWMSSVLLILVSQAKNLLGEVKGVKQ